MAEKQPKRYSEEVIEQILVKDYFKESNWKEYPSNRIRIDHVKYTWESIVKWEIKPYEGEKIRIKLQKLETREGEVAVKMKALKSGYITEDETVLRLTEEESNDLAQILSA